MARRWLLVRVTHPNQNSLTRMPTPKSTRVTRVYSYSDVPRTHVLPIPDDSERYK